MVLNSGIVMLLLVLSCFALLDLEVGVSSDSMCKFFHKAFPLGCMHKITKCLFSMLEYCILKITSSLKRNIK